VAVLCRNEAVARNLAHRRQQALITMPLFGCSLTMRWRWRV
jgi:hypothetical protein